MVSALKRFGLGNKGSVYCEMCYRKQDDSLSFEQKRDKCNYSTMGVYDLSRAYLQVVLLGGGI